MSLDGKKFLDDGKLALFWLGIKSYIATAIEPFVKKEEGKGLSSNDFTTIEKTKLGGLSNYTHPTTSGNKHIPSGGTAGQVLKNNGDGSVTWSTDDNTTYTDATVAKSGLMSAADKSKLDGVAAGAQVNVIEQIAVNGANLPTTGKKVSLSIPSITGLATETYVNQKIASSQHLSKKEVAALPPAASAELNVIYCVPKKDAEVGDYFDEYMLKEDKTAFFLVGSSKTSMTGYVKEDQIVFMTEADITNIMKL